MLRHSLSTATLLAAIGAATNAQCVVGTNSALRFDGLDDIAYAPDHSAFAGLDDFTIEFLARTTQRSTDGILFSKWRGSSGISTDDTFSVAMSPSGILRLQLATGNSWAWAATGTRAINDGRWHHVAMTRLGAVVSLFIDGQPDGAGTFRGTLSHSSTPVTFGNGLFYSTDTPGSRTWFSGDMDEVRLWNVARTPAQIASASNTGLSGSESGLVGYWRMDEGPSVQTLFNSARSTANALDGTLGRTLLVSFDDPTRIYTGLSTMPYCRPCPNPPCGQVNSACASLVVNGIGAGAQGPFDVTVPPGGTLTLQWAGAANQPWILLGTSNLVPGQVLFSPAFVVDLNLGNVQVLLGGLDPVWGPLFTLNDLGSGYGVASFSISVPNSAVGHTLNLQGIVLDRAAVCSAGLGFMSTASFSVHL